MKSILLAIAIISATTLFAQSKQEVFDGFEKIVKKAEGQKIESRGMTTPNKITTQQFNEQIVSVATKNTSKKSTESSYTYSAINWSELYKYKINQDRENDKIYEVTLYFEKNVITTYNSNYAKDKVQDPNSLVTIYIRTKDFEDFDKQVKLLSQVIPNKIQD